MGGKERFGNSAHRCEHIFIRVRDATGNKRGIVVCEVPCQTSCCEIRQTPSAGRVPAFPFKQLQSENLSDMPVLTGIGKAFFDVNH